MSGASGVAASFSFWSLFKGHDKASDGRGKEAANARCKQWKQASKCTYSHDIISKGRNLSTGYGRQQAEDEDRDVCLRMARCSI
jgi:hypothetical protein